MKPARLMTDAQIRAELELLGERWDATRADDEGHGGSPGEWAVERIGELGREQERRKAARPAGGVQALLATLGTNVRRLREQHDWTQGELAAQAAMTQSMVSDVERGTTNSSIETVWKLAKALGVGPLALLRNSTPRSRRTLAEGA